MFKQSGEAATITAIAIALGIIVLCALISATGAMLNVK